MYTLLKTGLLLFFRESNLPPETVSETHLSELFEEFIQELTAYSSDERRSIIERLRCMSFTLGQVSLLEKRKNRISESLLTDYMVRTLFLIDMEVRLLHLRLRYPPTFCSWSWGLSATSPFLRWRDGSYRLPASEPTTASSTPPA